MPGFLRSGHIGRCTDLPSPVFAWFEKLHAHVQYQPLTKIKALWPQLHISPFAHCGDSWHHTTHETDVKPLLGVSEKQSSNHASSQHTRVWKITSKCTSTTYIYSDAIHTYIHTSILGRMHKQTHTDTCTEITSQKCTVPLWEGPLGNIGPPPTLGSTSC